MVHRPPDSRLLNNLLSHEKDYSKHLSVLLDRSQASLASFSAYGAASTPPASQVIIAVAGALAGADDALRNYASAVEQWQEQLRALKSMEDDVGNIMRDREILVTRLIKASSKQPKSTRDFLGSSSSGSSLSVSKPEVQLGHRMSTAQSELQACEAQLAAKEHELTSFRTHTIRSGLQVRCKAMVECGWAWGEMGKECIRALEMLGMPNGHGSPSMHPYPHQEKASSDISSIAPSQSASQIGGDSSASNTLTDSTWRRSSVSMPSSAKLYNVQIPPAHSISESMLPNGVAPPATIAEETGGSSAEEEEEGGQLEMHENPRFNTGKTKVKPVPTASPSRHVSFSVRGPKTSSIHSVPTSHSLRGESPTKKRGRAGSMLGSLAALFHVGSRGDAQGGSPSPSKANGRWQTRIDKNVAAARRGGDSSDDESPALSSAPFANSKANGSADTGESARLKNRASKRSSVLTQSPSRIKEGVEKGYVSDTVAESLSNARAKGNRQQRVSSKGVTAHTSWAVAGASRLKKSPALATVLAAESGSSLSRNSSLSKQSITSVASAPPRTMQSALGRPNLPPAARKRTASLDQSPSKAGPSTSPGHKRTISTSTTAPPPRLTLTNGEPSLMSIVEGISRINKEALVRQDPNRLLVVSKAPGPVSISTSARDSLGELPVVTADSAAGESPVRRDRDQPKQDEGNNYRNSLLLSGSSSAPSLPLSASDRSKPLPTPVRMPLRSAMRNASRTPSPNPVQPVEVARNGSVTPKTKAAPPVAPIRPALAPAPSVVVAPFLTGERPAMTRRVSDTSSISSYETGHEGFDEHEPGPEPSPPPSPTPKPQPRTQPLVLTVRGTPDQALGGSEVSHSTDSTILTATGAEPPKRRKSVRMSLPPTFSATPPAIEDTDEDGAGTHAPWASPGGGSVAPRGWGTRIEENGARDVWEDSSDEDVEYSAAKMMLTKSARKHDR